MVGEDYEEEVEELMKFDGRIECRGRGGDEEMEEGVVKGVD